MRNNFLIIIIIILLFLNTGISEPRKDSTMLYQDAAKTALSGDLDKAITAFKEVIDISPSYSLGYYGLGKAYLYKEGMLDDALLYLKLAVKFDKSLSKGYFYLGMAFLLKKRYSDAVNTFLTAFNQDKTMVETLYNIGAIYDMLQNSHMSKQYFEDYLTRKEKSVDDIIF